MKSDAYDVVIVGGGPAGLAAARELGRYDISVALLDENQELGGQYFKRRSEGVRQHYGDHRPRGTQLIDSVRRAGTMCFTNQLVWGADGDILWTSDVRTGEVSQLRGEITLLATGAYERSIPFPGWTLPGVCTPGCALHFATVDRVRVGQHVLVAGSGPFLLAAAASLLEAGTELAGVIEVATPYRLSFRALTMAAYPSRVAELARYAVLLRRHGVRLRQGWRVASADGGERVTSVLIEPISGPEAPERLSVDALCVGYGFRPSIELLRLLGCACRIDPLSRDLVPSTDAFGRTSNPSIFAAGEIMGIAGFRAALIRGRLAAYAILSDLGITPSRAATDQSLFMARRFAHFAELVAKMFAIPRSLYSIVPDDTLVCRCESVTAGEVRDAARVPWSDLQAVKALTRAGMGLCQGRQCGNTVAALVQAESESDHYDGALSTRMPVKPLAYVAREPTGSGTGDSGP